MNIEDFREYCIAKAGTEECFPFDESTLVFKVMGKMFALTSLKNEDFRVNLKCDPDWAIELRETSEDILPGYHMSKKHWNTVVLENSYLEEDLVLKMIDHSYELVVKSLTKKLQAELKEYES